MIGLDSRNVVVTGASSGIGRAIAVACAKAGARTVLVGRNKEELERTRHAMERPDTHACIVCDLSDVAAVGPMMSAAATGGRIHGCVHAAGLEVTLPLKFVTYEKLDNAMRLHFYACVEMVKALSDRKVGADGISVVALSSVAADAGGKCQTVYSASKGALDAAIVPLSKEMATRGMRINSIRPSLIRTPMTEKWAAKKGIDNLDDLESTQLLGLGRPEDVAHVAVFLLGDGSRFITGQHITVDGGGPNDAIF